MTRVLVVEDDPAIGRSLVRNLSERGDVVAITPDGASGLAQALQDQPEVILLDLGLPDLGGLDVLAMLRAVSQIPVIVITAQDDDATVVKALDAGADDYLVKPFGGDELAARIRAVLRRAAASGGPESTVEVGELAINLVTRSVTMAGRSVELTRKEFDLLWLLASRPGEVVSKRDMLAGVWGMPFGGGDRTVDVHLSWLRRKLGESAASPRYLHTVRGVGVRLAPPVEES